MLATSESTPQMQWLTFSKSQEKLHLSLVNHNSVNDVNDAEHTQRVGFVVLGAAG